MEFKDFGLDLDVLDGINAMGYKNPTPIQIKAIPQIVAGKDVIGCAQTGTGKTAAFVLPVLHKILQLPADGINTLIIVPTRELAIQIDQQIDAISYFVDVKSMAIYGGGSGQNWVKQKRALTTGVDMIIATPGRLIAQMQVGDIDFSKLKFLILDEADRMLDMGFYDDIIRIVNKLPTQRQTLCFSATMPPKIRMLSKRILHQPVEISIAISKPAEGIKQIAYSVYEDNKLALVTKILKEGKFESVILFASRKEKVKKLNHELNRNGIKTKAFHSDLEQSERESLMQDFKNKHIAVLAGTDILSRGIDVEGIDLVINYDVPNDSEDYVHRVGRTARADKTGTAITLINLKDQRKFSRIIQMIGNEVQFEKMPEGMPEGPQFSPNKKAQNTKRKGKSNPHKNHPKGKSKAPKKPK